MPTSSLRSGGTVLVRKYGGSSLESIQRIRTVAQDINRERVRGHQVVVVVSAMGKTTDELAQLAHQANSRPPRRELDMLLSVGERITMSLLSMALAAEGCPAISLTGSQCAIITDNSHTDARILEVKGDRVRQGLADGCVVVVAGFQGVSLQKEITTLGRGGSDATAVALAAALGAERCEILKDVDGVMTADPKRIATARRIQALSYDELRDLAISGCGVVHLQAVEYAAEHGVNLFVGSSFRAGPGTHIGPEMAPVPTANGCPPNRPAPYRPLAMVVQENLGLLGATCPDAATAARWRETVLASLPGDTFLAEKLQRQAGCRWTALAPAHRLEPLFAALETALESEGGEVSFRPALGCITLAGGRPESWAVAEAELAPLLDRAGTAAWEIWADGNALRLLVPQSNLSNLPEILHQALFEA